MANDQRTRFVIVAVAFGLTLVGVTLLAVLAPGTRPYHETFDATGDWGVFVSVNPQGVGNVVDGVYRLYMPTAQQRVWAIGNTQGFGDGVYSVEVTQVAGPLRNGHGFIWRLTDDAEGRASFYFFVVSGDGMISAGYCYNDCAGEERNLTDGTWLATGAIRQGYDVTNMIAVRAEGPDFTFYVNGEAVWSASDPKFAAGDIGLMLEAYEQGGPEVYFDNFKVEGLE
ncbi:MAG: hypothetical protein JXB47_04120 [Anaerolineae bacterium]|nr:hypothetical protein [Anaerolineae bacterium]